MADGDRAVELLTSAFPEEVVGSGSFRDQHWACVRAGRLLDICRRLKSDPDTSYEVLLDVTAAHWPNDPDPIEIIYHFHSLTRNDRFRLKVRVAEGQPVPSLTELWASADWNEREAYDMFGVVFEGHPDLRRILMNEEYTDHPLRKEFPLYTG